MAKQIAVPDLGTKIELLLRSDKYPIKQSVQLYRALGISSDYFSRLKHGSRGLTEDKLLRLCELFDLRQKDWFDDLDAFGSRLGLSRKAISIIGKNPLPGIDFASRIRDKKVISDTLDVIGGYWESLYYSVSRTDKRVISRDLCIVRGIDADEFIDCEVIDGSFRYIGWCFPIRGHLYFILEKDRLFNEIIVYVTNHPDRHPPRLYGIILCISGGVNETASYPSAAKVVFRYIGRNEDEIRNRYTIPSSDTVEGYLKKTIPAYVDPATERDPDTLDILGDLANVIGNDSIPLALRMTK